MNIKLAKKFSNNPDLTVVFTSCIKESSRNRLFVKPTTRLMGSRRSSKNILSMQDHLLSIFCVYSKEASFYNEIVSYVKNQFFMAKEEENFSLYEQGRFREVRYVALPIEAGSLKEGQSLAAKSGGKNLAKTSGNAKGTSGAKLLGQGGSLENGGEDAGEEISAAQFLEHVRHIAGDLFRREARKRNWEIDLSGIKNIISRFDLRGEDFIAAFAEGMALGQYHFSYQTKKPTSAEPKGTALGEHQVTLIDSGLPESSAQAAAQMGLKTAKAVGLARDLANAAPNDLNIPQFVRRATEVAKAGNLKLSRLRHKDLVKGGFGGILAVNKGSRHKAELLILDYMPPRAKKADKSRVNETILLVGKGVLFDSGGLSIKNTSGMVDMKMDMSGAAVVLAVMSTLHALKLGVRVVAALPVTDNMIGPDSMCVGDVLKMHNQKSVEVLNTDAEGRLILADALSYAIKKYRPQHTIDLATLTGACMIALGHSYAGLWTNDDSLASAIMAAGEAKQEPVWRMPLHKDYLGDLKSLVADLKNVSGPYGSANTAAKFLEQFVDGASWAHLDIAGMMLQSQTVGAKNKGASGYGVRLLLHFLANRG